jgi:hypothetical protein
MLLLLLLLAGITCNGSRPRSHVRRVKRAGAAQRGRTVLMVTAGIAHAVLQSKACGARLQLLLRRKCRRAHEFEALRVLEQGLKAVEHARTEFRLKCGDCSGFTVTVQCCT